MRTCAIVLLLSVLCLCVVSPSRAATPTPMPTETGYNRSDLLSQIHVKSYTFQPNSPFHVDFNQFLSAVVGEGASYNLTFSDMITRAGALTFFVGAMVVLFIVFVMVRFILKRTGNQTTRFKNKITQNVVYRGATQTRSNFRHFRGRK